MTASLLVAAPFPQAAAENDPQDTKKATKPAITTFPHPEDPDAALRAAVEEARKTNKPVTVDDAFTETSRTWAYPDGHLTTESYSGPTQLRQGDGSWAWIDTSLVEQNGVLKPKLAKAKVRLSTGGSGPFATMVLDRDRSLGLSWPASLPKPTIKGNVATYPGVAGPSGDLVVTALPTGFRHDIVLRERPTGPVEFRIPVEAKGLKLSVTKAGGLKLKSDKGKKVASAPAPLMWDAAADEPTAAKPGREKKIDASVESKSGSTTLVLKPDAAWLADPATQYPVTVDPTTTLGITQEVGISSPDSQRSPGTVGRMNYSGTEQATRTLMAFDTAPIAGKQVTKATMQLQLREDVYNCSEFQGIAAQRITESWVADDTYWGNQPASTEEGRASIDPCALPGTSGAIWSWNLTAMTRLWATGTPNHGLVLKLTQESSTPRNYSEDFLFWPQLFNQGVLPKLSVDWVLPPEIPTVTAESIDSMDGNDAIARSTNVKVTYKSSVPEATPLNYTVTVNDSTMAPPATELPAGEVAYWKLDEASGTTVTDSSGNNRNATLSGAHTRTPGQLGQAVNFTGGHAATSGPVINTNQSFTASAWVRLDNSTQEQSVLSQMGTNLPGFTLSYQTSTAPEYDQRWVLSMINQDIPDSIHETVIQSEHLAKIGEWTHVAAQYDKDAGKIRLYVDGVLAGERDHTVSWNARGAFEIGRARVLGGSLKGSVDDIHVYQRALSANELRALVGVPGTTSHNNIPSGQALDKVFTLDNPASFKFVVKACRAGVTPPSCNESPAYRITSDAPVLPSDTETGMANPTQPILSGMVNRPSGGPVTAKYYLYDSTGAPVGSAPLGSRTVNGGERASFQVPANTVQPGSTYKWQMTACVTAPQGEDPGPDPDPDPDPTPTPDPDPDPTPTPTPTPSGLVAAYGMNEGSGTTVNDATGTNDGTAIDTSWVNGKYGKALAFDGIFSLVTVEDSPSLRLNTGLTLSAWVKPSSVDGWHTVMGKDLATFEDLSYALYASSGSTPTGWLTTENEPVRVDGTDSLPVNTWKHLAVTYDGSKARLYLNGAQVGEEPASGALLDDGGDFHIGGNTIYGELFDGVIDEVRVYNRAQTAAEISTDMNTPLAGVTSSANARTTGMATVTEDGPGSEVCTSKTAPVNFTTPGTPPPPPAEDVRHLTLGKDNFVIKTTKTDPTACDDNPCPVTDDTVMRIGGIGTDKMAAVVGFKLDELPDSAGASEGILKLGTPTCATDTCPTDAVITVTPLKSPVTGESMGSELAADSDDSRDPYSLPVSAPQADVAGSIYQWLLLTSNKDEMITFGEVAASEQPSLALTYLPAGRPSKVLNLAAQAGDASAIASWGLPESNGSLAMLAGYDVEVTNNAGSVVSTLEVMEPHAAITGLTNGEIHTVKVRAKTVFGASDWEAATVTPKAVPPPPAKDVNQPCIPFLDGEQPQTRATAQSGAQKYIDRVKAYYQAQDAVLEGRAETIWDASGVAPSDPNTAKLSLLNTTVVQQYKALKEGGQVRTGSSVDLHDVVVYARPDGSIAVLAKVERNWTVSPNSNAAQRLAGAAEGGAVEPSPPTIEVHVFDRCGNMERIVVPIPDYADSTDFYDPGSVCGSLPPNGLVSTKSAAGDQYCDDGETWPPAGAPQECENRVYTFNGEHACKHAWVSKFWQVKLEMGANWETGDTPINAKTAGAGGYPHKWSATNYVTYMRLFPTQGEKWNSAFGKMLVKNTTMSIGEEVCFGVTETQTTETAGLQAGGSAEPGKIGGSVLFSVSINKTKTTRLKCNTYKYKAADPAKDPKIAWTQALVQGKCDSLKIEECNLYRYNRTVTGRLVFKRDKMNPKPQLDNLELALGCDFRRFGTKYGSSGTRVYVNCVDRCIRTATPIPFPEN